MSKKQELVDAKSLLEMYEMQLEKLQSRIPNIKKEIKELEVEAALEAETPAKKEEE